MARILIVDDEPDIITLITRYAKRDGYDVASAEDGRQAIEACQKEDFDIRVMMG